MLNLFQYLKFCYCLENRFVFSRNGTTDRSFCIILYATPNIFFFFFFMLWLLLLLFVFIRMLNMRLWEIYAPHPSTTLHYTAPHRTAHYSSAHFATTSRCNAIDNLISIAIAINTSSRTLWFLPAFIFFLSILLICFIIYRNDVTHSCNSSNYSQRVTDIVL